MALGGIGSSSGVFPTISQIEQRQRQQSTASDQLASGQRLVSAAIDAAGSALAQELTAQVKGLSQAQRNSVDAGSLFQTAGSAVSSIQNSLQQERRLGLEAANGTLTASDRQAIQAQVTQITMGVNDVANQTRFNTKPLLNGQANNLTFQVGANAGETVQASIGSQTPAQLGIADLNVTNGQAQNAISQIDTAIQSTSQQQANIGATENRLTSASGNASSAQGNALSSRSLVSDTNLAKASGALASSLLQQQFSLFALQQQASVFSLQNQLLVA